MASRPELQAPPEIFYDVVEARKYTSSSRIIDIHAKLFERALELLALPDDGIHRLLLDIGDLTLSGGQSFVSLSVYVRANSRPHVEIKEGCGSGLSGETLSDNGHVWIGLDISPSMLNVASEREVDGDLLLGDMGQGLGLRSGVIDGAISISAVQWLCNADKSSHAPRLRLKAFFGSLYRCLARGARAVFQVYPESVAQRAGFAGGVVVDYPHSSKSRKEYLVLTCGPPSMATSVPSGKGEDGESCSDDSSYDEGEGMVSSSDRHRRRKKQKVNKKGRGREWVLDMKEQMRRKGNAVPPDSQVHSGQTEGSVLKVTDGLHSTFSYEFWKWIHIKNLTHWKMDIDQAAHYSL